MQQPLYTVKIYFLAVCLLAAMALPCRGQQPWRQWFIKTYPPAECLAGREGGLLQRDSRGYYWIGAPQGLSRFDGHSFTYFTTLDGLKENTITDLKLDQAGLVYAATPTAIHRYTGGQPAFYRYPVAVPQGCRVICPAGGHRFWIGAARGHTLYRYDSAGLAPMPVKGAVMALEQDREGYVYGLTDQQQLYIIVKDTVIKSLTVPAAGASLPHPLHKDQQGQVWCAGSAYLYRLGPWGIADSVLLPAPPGQGYLRGRFCLAGDTLRQWQNGRWRSLLPLPVPAADVHDLLGGRAGQYLLLTREGLLHLYPKTYAQEDQPGARYILTTLPSQTPLLMKDTPAQVHPAHPSFVNRLRHILTAVYRSRDGTLFYLTRQGLYYLPPQARQLQHYSPAGNGGPVPFTSATEDGAGATWLTAGNGMYFYKNGLIVPFALAGLQPGQAVTASAADRWGAIYAIAGQLYILKQGRFQLANCAGPEARPVKGLTTDNDGNLWLWTDSSVLLKVVPDERGCLLIIGQVEVAVNGEAAIPLTAAFDQNGNLWVLTRTRLHIFLRLPDGRFSPGEQLVMGAGQRICDLAQEGCRLLRGQGQDMYLQNDRQHYRFDAGRTIRQDYRTAPTLHFTGVQWDQQPLQYPTATGAADSVPPAAIRLPGGRHTLSFSYAALCPTLLSGVVYRCQLLGAGDGWQPPTRLASAAYTSLPPGQYTFMVQAANDSGVWCDPLSFSFYIAPPWYATRWALMMWTALAASLSLLLAGYFLRTRRRKKELETIVIEQQLKTIRAQINPHFLQNSFEFLAQSIRLGSPENSITIIHRISRYFRHILHKSDQSIVTLEAELESAEEYLSLKKMILYDAFDSTIHIAEEVDTFGVKLPSLLLQPLVENAIKYGVNVAARTGYISIDVQQDEHFVIITIADNGNGRNAYNAKKAGHQSKGLELTRKRLALLYGRHKNKPSVDLMPRYNGGTSVTVKIPLD